MGGADMSAQDVSDYLAGLDTHLATVPELEARLRVLDAERARMERIERAVAAWAEKGKGESPSRFSAWDLGILDGEISIRMQRDREKIGA
jgi:hypothetical protein